MLLGILGLLAIVEIIRLLVTSSRQSWPLLITFCVAAAPYVLVQPLIRYRYIVYGLSVFLAFSLVSWTFSRLFRRETSAMPHPQLGAYAGHV